MIFVVWLMSVSCSWLAAWAAGKAWAESRQAGGAMWLASWIIAAMSAVGFTWCYFALFAIVGSAIPMRGEEMIYVVRADKLRAVFELRNVAVIAPILGLCLSAAVNISARIYRASSWDDPCVRYPMFVPIYEIYRDVDPLPDVLQVFWLDRRNGRGCLDIESLILKMAVLAVMNIFCGVIIARAVLMLSARRHVEHLHAVYFDRGVH